MSVLTLYEFFFRIFRVQARQPQGILQWSYNIITFPFRFVYSALCNLIRFACKYRSGINILHLVVEISVIYNFLSGVFVTFAITYLLETTFFF